MAKVERRHFTDGYKQKMVGRVQAGMTIRQAAEKFELSESVVRHWTRDPRYGGNENSHRRGTNGAIPTKRKSPSPRAKAAVATAWKCPHCGQSLLIGGEA